jgi:hypothetical protein
MKADELHEQALKIVEPCFLKAQEEAMAQYKQLAGSEWASNSLEPIIQGAYDGRIDTLFVAVGVQQWGVFDPKMRQVHLHQEPEPGDGDLLDFAAVHTYLNGGTVYALKPEEMPDQTTLAVLFRF